MRYARIRRAPCGTALARWRSASQCSSFSATAGFVGYDYWTETRANRSGDAFSQALALANDGKNDEALGALQALEADGYGAYPLLARMRAATVLAAKGDFAGAVAGFDAVSADTSIPAAIRDMASLRAALLLVDHGTYAEVAARAEALTSDADPLRHSAREALGLSAWKEARAVGCAEAVPADRRRRGSAAERPPARHADDRTDPRFRRGFLSHGLPDRHYRPA